MERPADLRDLLPRKALSPPPTGAEDLEVPLKEGSLPVRLFLTKEVGPTLFFFHAEGETVDHYDTLGENLNNFGISLVVIGYRGRGKGGGEPAFENIFSDALQAFDYLENYLHERERKSIIALLGRSLGAGVALAVAAQRADRVSALILDSPIIDGKEWLVRRNLRLAEDPFRIMERLKQWRKALLIFQAQLDE